MAFIAIIPVAILNISETDTEDISCDKLTCDAIVRNITLLTKKEINVITSTFHSVEIAGLLESSLSSLRPGLSIVLRTNILK